MGREVEEIVRDVHTNKPTRNFERGEHPRARILHSVSRDRSDCPENRSLRDIHSFPRDSLSLDGETHDGIDELLEIE